MSDCCVNYNIIYFKKLHFYNVYKICDKPKSQKNQALRYCNVFHMYIAYI